MENTIDWNFKKEDWEFERSSGYAGERNKITGEWINSEEYTLRTSMLEQFRAFQLCAGFFKMDLPDDIEKELFEEFRDQFYIIHHSK